jgi:hypothetical protein
VQYGKASTDAEICDFALLMHDEMGSLGVLVSCKAAFLEMGSLGVLVSCKAAFLVIRV